MIVMRRIVLAALLVLTLQFSGQTSLKAQTGMPAMGPSIGSIGADPFSGYYSWFLPRQAAMAAQPTLNNQLNMYTAERVASQNMPANGLNSMDLAGLGLAGANAPSLDSDAPRNPRPRLSSTGPIVENSMGKGLGRYHSRAGSYYPTMRQGTYGNNGLPKTSRGR